ncbi:hypothetical protein ACFX2A_040625 [Malus domestica]
MLERKCSSMSEELSSDVQAHPSHKRSASVQIRFDLGDLGSLTEFNLGDFSLHGGVSPSSQVFTCKFSADHIQRSKPLQSELRTRQVQGDVADGPFRSALSRRRIGLVLQ